MVKLKKYIFPVAFILVSFLMLITSFSKGVIIIDDKEIQFWTRSTTVNGIIKELKLELGKYDQVYPTVTTALAEVDEIRIKRGHKVSLMVNGKVQEVISTAQDVADFLNENNVKVNQLDIVNPSLNEKISDGLEVQVIRVAKAVLKKEEEIPFPIEYKDDGKLLRGQTKTLQKGENGVVLKSFLVKSHDGKEIRKELLKEEIIKEPTPKIILQGTKTTVQRAGKNIKFSKTLTLNATAYTHTGNKTYTDKWPQRGTVAVDPQLIPLGTRLYIDGYGYAVAEDIGSAIKGNRIDLFMESRKEALKWGRRLVKVYILEDKKI